MTELKAKDCPLCATPALTADGSQGPKACCADRDCDLSELWIDLAQWNTRPRERELEEALRQAANHLDLICIQHWSLDTTSGNPCQCDCQKCMANAKALSTINAALGKGGES